MRSGIMRIPIILIIIAYNHIQAQTESPILDFYTPWLMRDTANLKSPSFQGIVSQPEDPQLGFSLGYSAGRYALPAWIEAFQVDHRDSNLAHLSFVIDTLLGYERFRDTSSNVIALSVSPNGYIDGFRGWGNIRWFSFFSLPPEDSITQGKSFRYIIRIDTTDDIRFRARVWIRPDSNTINTDTTLPIYDVTCLPWRAITGHDSLQVGTIALLSGWSKTHFKQLKIFRINPSGNKTLLYDAANRAADSLLHSDWSFVGDTNYTAGWNQWKIEPNGDIWCDAASSSPLSYSGGIHKFVGKYSALVFDPDSIRYNPDTMRISLSDLRSVQIECVIQIDRRNIANAESGIALRWINPMNPTAAGNLEGEISNSPFAGGSELFQFNPQDTTFVSYFKPSSVYLAFKLRPHNCLEAIEHIRLDEYGTKNWWIGPYDVNPDVALNSTNIADGGYYDEDITADAIIAANIAYYKQFATGSQWQGQAASAVTTVEENIIKKWKALLNRDTQTWVYGGGGKPLGTRSLGGLDRGLIWVQDLAKIGLMGLSLKKNGNTSQDYQNFYTYLYTTSLRLILEEYVHRVAGHYLWWENTDYIAEMNPHVGQNDLGHMGPVIYYLHEAWKDSAVTGINKLTMDTLARTFTESIWNGRTGNNCVLYKQMDGVGDTLYQASGSVLFTDWQLLSCADFRVWESSYDYINRYWYNYYQQGFGRTPADMLYAVRYGKPRNLKLISMHDCSQNGYLLRWDPPSDYPIGRKERPGTRLRYYNVYKRSSSNGGSTWNAWHRAAQIPIHSDTATVHGIQDDYDYPFWTDTKADAESLYAYVVRTQDWSSAITNESFDSNELHVQYTDPVALLQIPTRDSCFTITDSTITVSSSDTLGGLWFIPSDLQVDHNVTLTLRPNTVLTFQKGTELLVHGNLVAVDDADSCWITFRGEEETPGTWWGISMFGPTNMSYHNLYHCRIRDGINNIVIYNDESRLEECDITGASQYGVIYGHGNSHTHLNNHIHHNGLTNLLLHSPETRLTVESDVIDHALTADGVAVVDSACPTFSGCEVTENAQHGISLWHAFYHLSPSRPNILSSTIANNGTEGYGDGIHMYDSHALLRLNNIRANHNAGIDMTAQSELNIVMSAGTDGGNLLDSNDVNFSTDNSFCDFGYCENQDECFGHWNCFTNPLQYQVWAQNGYILLHANYYDQTGPAWFNDSKWIDMQYATGSCEGGPATIRLAGEDIPATNRSVFAKTGFPRSVRQAARFLSAGAVDDAADLLKDILADRDSLIGEQHLLLARLIFQRTQDKSILTHLKNAVGQGRCDETKYRLIAASCLRDAGKFGNALAMLGDLGEGLPLKLRRAIEIERSHATVLKKGADASNEEFARLT